MLMTHGTADPLLPIAQVRPQIPLLTAAGINVKWCEFDKVHTIIEEELVLVRDFVRAGILWGKDRCEGWMKGLARRPDFVSSFSINPPPSS